MSTLELVLWWAVVLVGLGGSAMCSGLEVGLYTVNRVLVRVHAAATDSARGGHRARVLESQIEQSTSTLTALLVWNNMFNYAGTLAITTLIATLGLADLEMILIQVVVLTPVLLIFAESTPKEIFRSHADVLMERYAHVIRVMRLSLTWVPIVPVVLWLANLASRLVGVDSLGSLTTARERMAELVKYGSSQMSDAQVSLIDRALELEHATVRSEMIPLRNAQVVRSNWSIAKARGFVRQHPYTRYPMMSSRGQVEGILCSIDLYTGSFERLDEPISGLVHEPVRVDGSMTVTQALGQLARQSGRLGIVSVGGRDVGMVTRKDLIEPLVGELEDW
jgi:magnesium and cobalt exporter, CNNM family